MWWLMSLQDSTTYEEWFASLPVSWIEIQFHRIMWRTTSDFAWWNIARLQEKTVQWMQAHRSSPSVKNPSKDEHKLLRIWTRDPEVETVRPQLVCLSAVYPNGRKGSRDSLCSLLWIPKNVNTSTYGLLRWIRDANGWIQWQIINENAMTQKQSNPQVTG